MSTSNESAAPSAHRPLQVVYQATGSLVPDPRNARTHPKRQIAQIVASIRAFGFTNPILADPDGNLIAGHGRLRAATGWRRSCWRKGPIRLFCWFTKEAGWIRAKIWQVALR
jgi:hypothetical protein